MTDPPKKRLRIGFDISQTAPGAAGCGQMADALVRTLIDLYPEDEFILYPVFGTLYFDPHEAKRMKPIERPHVHYRLAEFRAADIRLFWKHPPQNAWSLLGSPDVIHANNFSCPILPGIRVVYTLHDMAFLDHPESTSLENAAVCGQGVDTASRFADMIVAVSEFSRKRFLEVYPDFPEDRIRVLHLGSRFETFDRDEPVEGLRENGFWLSVGTLEPRKNLRHLLRAYAIHVRSSNDVLPLALAGGRGWLEEGLETFIGELGLTDSVFLLGYVNDAQLRWLYRNCWAFCFPSRYEGFGLPVLEAMSVGAAVMSSGVTSLPEIGGDAFLYVNPFNVDDITRGFNALAGNVGLRESLRSKGALTASRFSWRQTAGNMRKIYAECVELPKRVRTISAVKAGNAGDDSPNAIVPKQDMGCDFPQATIRQRLEVAVYLFVKRRKGLKAWLRRLPLVSLLLAAYHRSARPREG